MDKKLVEKQLESLKSQIEINNDLKHELRSTFACKRTRKWKLTAVAVIAAAICIIFVVHIVLPGKYITKVNAASLKILNQVSFTDLGESHGEVAEHNGIIYRNVYGEGIFAYDSNGYHEIYKKDVSGLSVSHNGKRLAFCDGNLNIFDIAGSKATVLLNGGDLTYYEQPSWSPDDRYIIFVKRVRAIIPGATHGFEDKESAICEIDLKTMKVTKLADGNSPSYVNGEKAIVFEKENKIIRKNISDGSEIVVDTGRFPSVSPNGEYVAYVKTERKENKISLNLSVAENIEDIWIADVNLKTSRKVTSNYLKPDDSSEGKIEANTSDIPMSIEKSGMYDYYDPKWSSNSESLYVIKDNNKEENMNLIRISFTDHKLTAEDTVANFMQALISRDDDYAKSLMKNPPAILTCSNPHPVGYKILKSGAENGKDYVEAEIYSAYSAHPDFHVSRERYYLKLENNGYIIDEVIDENGVIVKLSNDGQSVIMEREKEQILFNIKDIPSDYLLQGDYRFASLAFNEQNNTLVFTIQGLQDSVSVRVLSYNIQDSTFKFIGEIKKIRDMDNVVIESLIMDPTGSYAALNLFSDNDPEFKTSVLVYNLNNNQSVDIAGLLKNIDNNGIYTNSWDKDGLKFVLKSNEQKLSYMYNPDKGELSSFSEQ